MVTPKIQRMARHDYPDARLLERLERVRLGEASIPEHEILQFRRLQALIYALRLAGHDIEALQTETFIGAMLYAPVKCKVAVTRCEFDTEVNAETVRRIAGNLFGDLTWFTTNANIDHPRVRPLPLGLTDYCGYSPYHQLIGDTERFTTLIDETPRSEENLVLLNFLDETNASVRGMVRTLFESRTFVTDSVYVRDAEGHSAYVRALRSHAFCLAPRGNGIDTHRLWEALYAGCIPIVERHLALRDFTDLPILFIDDWREACDRQALEAVRRDFQDRIWDLRKLTLSYWYSKVCEPLSAAFGDVV